MSVFKYLTKIEYPNVLSSDEHKSYCQTVALVWKRPGLKTIWLNRFATCVTTYTSGKVYAMTLMGVWQGRLQATFSRRHRDTFCNVSNRHEWPARLLIYSRDLTWGLSVKLAILPCSWTNSCMSVCVITHKWTFQYSKYFLNQLFAQAHPWMIQHLHN